MADSSADVDRLRAGREAFRRRAWMESCMHLAAADRDGPLSCGDLEQLATAAYLAGRHAESGDAWTRAHHEHLRRGDIPRAVRCAFWLASGLLHHGARARARAWLDRAEALLAEGGETYAACVEQGYLLLPRALQALVEGAAEGAYELFCRAGAIGSQYGDPDLVALAQHSSGRVLLRLGRRDEGIRLLDTAMIAVESGEVSPLVIGETYCSVIEGCLEVFDLRRAREWTASLTRWWETQPDLVPYTGQCLVRRAEILQLHGAWDDAAAAAREAYERLQDPRDQPAAGAALYQRAELHRLRGEFTQAEDLYREASRYGRRPQPGLALLRLAQGQTASAATAIRVALDETPAPAARARLLPAAVDILLAAGDAAAADAAAQELANRAVEFDAPFLHAIATHARGAVLVSAGEPRAALPVLRQAWTGWQDLEAPYHAARVRVLIGLAYRALGDRDAADMELDAARWVFEQLGATPDLLHVQRLAARPSGPAGPLTSRELQVLRLVAAGRSNRHIAEELLISERTVERHVSNIFLKLDVSSRASATAYAYEHQLV